MRDIINIRYLLIVVAVGLVIGLLFMLSFGFDDLSYLRGQLLYSLLTTALIWGGCMVIVSYLWRRFPWEHNPGKHLLLEVLLITSYTLLIIGLLFMVDPEAVTSEETPMAIFNTLLITFLVTAIHEAVFFFRQWRLHFNRTVKLERDHLRARYDALQSQVNPHFLFNSLNSLTTLVEDNREAVSYIGNLSEMLRYMLKENEKKVVLLRDELEFVRHYLALQEMRFKERLCVDINIEESWLHHTLPPLALQMVVENAIKHNTIMHDKPLYIRIRTMDASVVVVNNLQKKSVLHSTGKGLDNLRGRYQPLTARNIRVVQTETHFSVSLPLIPFQL